jgi:hypothetical protein
MARVCGALGDTPGPCGIDGAGVWGTVSAAARVNESRVGFTELLDGSSITVLALT